MLPHWLGSVQVVLASNHDVACTPINSIETFAQRGGNYTVCVHCVLFFRQFRRETTPIFIHEKSRTNHKNTHTGSPGGGLREGGWVDQGVGGWVGSSFGQLWQMGIPPPPPGCRGPFWGQPGTRLNTEVGCGSWTSPFADSCVFSFHLSFHLSSSHVNKDLQLWCRTAW